MRMCEMKTKRIIQCRILSLFCIHKEIKIFQKCRPHLQIFTLIYLAYFLFSLFRHLELRECACSREKKYSQHWFLYISVDALTILFNANANLK